MSSHFFHKSQFMHNILGLAVDYPLKIPRMRNNLTSVSRNQAETALDLRALAQRAAKTATTTAR